ncbi:hypothetical protein NDU88_003666 [Pleurodeles waltl]|uniref:Uncharacterized protein n=1 Tax=Pleurodeles waltl TaxID=8319 RepID=A0AAV7LGE9_PLEWA|nr:hypothetical protein NDU88_003666 [Pleurodeles waltl]
MSSAPVLVTTSPSSGKPGVPGSLRPPDWVAVQRPSARGPRRSPPSTRRIYGRRLLIAAANSPLCRMGNSRSSCCSLPLRVFELAGRGVLRRSGIFADSILQSAMLRVLTRLSCSRRCSSPLAQVGYWVTVPPLLLSGKWCRIPRSEAPSRGALLFHLNGADFLTRSPSWIFGVTESIRSFLHACPIGAVVIVLVFARGSADVGTAFVRVIWAYLRLGFDRVPFSAPERRAKRAASSAAGHAPPTRYPL